MKITAVNVVLEGCTIQQQFVGGCHQSAHSSDSDQRRAYSFAKLMFDGKTKPSLDLLFGVCREKRLSLNQFVDSAETTTVQEVLRAKHPSATPGCLCK